MSSYQLCRVITAFVIAFALARSTTDGESFRYQRSLIGVTVGECVNSVKATRQETRLRAFEMIGGTMLDFILANVRVMLGSGVNRRRASRHRGMLCGLFFAGLIGAFGAAAAHGEPAGRLQGISGTNSQSVRNEAVAAIPIDKLDAKSQVKVKEVLANLTVFRRLPIRVIECNPDLYLFIARNPDVMVGIWETLKLSQLQLRRNGPSSFRVVESDGTTINFEYLYQTHDTHIVYAEGVYTGALANRPVRGTCVCVLKTGYVRETNGRYYITSRLDAFLSVEPGAIEIVAKTLQPIGGRIADSNFVQTLAFVGSLSETAKANPEGLYRVSRRMTNITPELREQFDACIGKVAQEAFAGHGVELAVPQAQRHAAGGPTPAQHLTPLRR